MDRRCSASRQRTSGSTPIYGRFLTQSDNDLAQGRNRPVEHASRQGRTLARSQQLGNPVAAGGLLSISKVTPAAAAAQPQKGGDPIYGEKGTGI